MLLLFFQFVTVPPMVKLPSKVFVGREQTVSLICEVEGNPTPIISWSPCHGKDVSCVEQYLNISDVQTARANYTCRASNALGEDSATTLLRKSPLLHTCSFLARICMSFVVVLKLNCMIPAISFA